MLVPYSKSLLYYGTTLLQHRLLSHYLLSITTMEYKLPVCDYIYRSIIYLDIYNQGLVLRLSQDKSNSLFLSLSSCDTSVLDLLV